ncbi:MAG: DNA-directed RNA polymerase subunit alpha C-terminal domain-containing protein [Bacteroidota bacterium]
MKKEISDFLLSIFQDEAFLLKLGLSPQESSIFYQVLNGATLKEIAKQNQQSIKAIKLTKQRCYRLIPLLIRRKVAFFQDSELEKINGKFYELDLLLSRYFDFTHAYNQSRKVKELNLSTRTINALRAYGITDITDLMRTSYEEIAGIHNLGENALMELELELSRFDVYWKPPST